MLMKTASVILISDEFLKDATVPTAQLFQIPQFFTKELQVLGFTLKKFVILPENSGAVQHEIENLVKYCDIVVTTGGVRNGFIYGVLGQSIQQPLVPNSELALFMKSSCCKQEISIPISARVIAHDSEIYPLIYFQRIFILHDSLEVIQNTFNQILRPILQKYRNEKQFRSIAKITLNGNSSKFNTQTDYEKAVNRVDDNVIIKDVRKESQNLIVDFCAAKLSYLMTFEDKMNETFGFAIEGFEHPDEVWNEIYSSSDLHIKTAIQDIETCLSCYGPENVFLSFNGGKDCTVLLHLILVVMKKHYPKHLDPILCVYVQSKDPFPEQDEFINLCQKYYNLKIELIQAGIKEALEHILQKKPNYKACFMGTRHTDPYSADLQVFQMTDSNWPQIMRVSPLLKWHYSDIWDYLLYYKVPYCELYNLGFTSLGNIVNTIKNPSLVYYDVYEEKDSYLPAYKLLTETKERNGRNHVS